MHLSLKLFICLFKKDKLRAGDILGELTEEAGLEGKSIRKIDVYERQSYVVLESSLIDQAHKRLSKGKIKNKRFSVWVL